MYLAVLGNSNSSGRDDSSAERVRAGTPGVLLATRDLGSRADRLLVVVAEPSGAVWKLQIDARIMVYSQQPRTVSRVTSV